MRGDCREHGASDHGRVLVANTTQRLDQLLLAERLAAPVHRFRHAVAIEAEHVARRQGDSRRLVRNFREEAEKEIPLVETAYGAVARDDNRDVVSRANVAEMASTLVDLRKHHRHERARARVLVDEPVQILRRALEIVVVAQEVAAKDRAHRRIEERGGNALAANVGDCEHDRAIAASVEDVVAIA